MPEGERNYRPHVISIYQLFPNTLLIWQLDHIEIWRAFPGRDDPSHCDVEMTIYKPADSDAARLLLGEEPRHRHPHRDGGGLPAGRAHADRLRIGRHQEVIYGRNEPSLVHFHSSIRNALAQAST